MADDVAEPAEMAGTPRAHVCPIVGIGASAGGIDALKHLFPKVQANSGLAYVVVMHLDPTHSSVLHDIVAHNTCLPVHTVNRRTRIVANHAYVIAPDTLLTVSDGCLMPASPRLHTYPIDSFLVSLARDQGESSACVILSGTGSDGTIGLRAIKESGGLIVAQAGAEYDGMMRSAVATGLVDVVLPAQEIPAGLTDYFGRLNSSIGRAPDKDADDDISEHLRQIAALIRAQTGHDFSNYKERTIIRRVQRRMHVLQIDDMSRFIERLHRDSRQVTLLFEDLLIGVTHFFREPAAFEALQRLVLPDLLRNRGPNDTVRVWVPGCATGEEAYSLAMLLRDAAPDQRRAPKLQVFASDIDEHALAVARTGRYPSTIESDISAERLNRYFIAEEGSYRVISELREMCLFSAHNLLRDTPFSKLDLISCRNLLIYLNSELQDRLIPLFHYALVPAGTLFLGSSENATRHGRLFTTIDKTFRVFQRKPSAERRIPQFPLTTGEPGARAPGSPSRRMAADNSLKSRAERHLLDRFTPAYTVVNAEGDILQSSGNTGKYLELPAGPPDMNIFNLARPALKLDLRSAFYNATTSKQPVVQRGVSLGTHGGRMDLDLFVQPLRLENTVELLFMIVFKDVGEPQPASGSDGDETGEATDSGLLALEADLRATRDRLQTTTEELESSNEELKSGNEELYSINEEMQSANEELETSKEELQSINEELHTVNAELAARVEELSRANNDMNNLLESTQIATVFLDRNLMVKSFTPAAKDVFRLVESDAGRPITHVRQRIDADTLAEDAQRVLRSLLPVERPVRNAETGTRYMMRILPYRTTDNVISGVVMTFTDITRVSFAEARVEQLTYDLRRRNELETMLDLVPVGVMIIDSGREGVCLVNPFGARILGEQEQHTGLKSAEVSFLIVDESGGALAEDQHPIYRATRGGETVIAWEGQLRRSKGGDLPVMLSACPLFTDEGTVRGAVIAVMDISRRKKDEAQQAFLLGELQHRVKNILATVASLATRMTRLATSMEAFRDPFLARLDAMARTHDLLSRDAWSGASLNLLIQAALAPFSAEASDTLHMTGPTVEIAPNAATTLGMIFHELATNAAKYGALSKQGGRLDISWSIGGAADELALTWAEHGGPLVDPQATRGFGTGFMTRSVEYELLGKADLELAPAGIRYTIAIPLLGNVENAPQPAG